MTTYNLVRIGERGFAWSTNLGSGAVLWCRAGSGLMKV
jgi:hypothetical protein